MAQHVPRRRVEVGWNGIMFPRLLKHRCLVHIALIHTASWIGARIKLRIERHNGLATSFFVTVAE